MTQVGQIDDVLRAAIDRGDVPGVVAMAGTRDGVAYQGAFERRALPDEAAMTTNTVFWLASMAKAVTSAAAMQLVEQGKLALDHPIRYVLPELSAPQVLEAFDPSGQPILRAARRADHPPPSSHAYGRVRLRHLECRDGPVHGGKGRSWDHHL